MDRESAYRILGLDPGASAEQIEAAAASLSREIDERVQNAPTEPPQQDRADRAEVAEARSILLSPEPAAPDPGRRRVGILLGLAAAALAVVLSYPLWGEGLSSWWQNLSRAGELREEAAEVARKRKSADDRRLEMVAVPAGEFLYGCNAEVDQACWSTETLARRITLPAFQIDKTEVTVSAYRECVQAGACREPDSGGDMNWGSGRDTHPVNGVSRKDARAYCSWSGVRLPSEQEWEKAARGEDGRTYPWGNAEASCDHAVIREFKQPDGCGSDSTWPVGSKPSGASPYGALDMSGNVWEWTSRPYNSRAEDAVVRGGAWDDWPKNARSARRFRAQPTLRNRGVGFRCVQ